MKFRSNFEKDIAKNLKARSIDFEYESVHLPYKKQDTINSLTRKLHGLSKDFKSYTYHTYLVDFTITNKSGKVIHIEAKGEFTASDRVKMKLVKEQNPDADIRMLLMYDNKINKNSKTRYSDFCRANGILFKVGKRIPDNWLEE